MPTVPPTHRPVARPSAVIGVTVADVAWAVWLAVPLMVTLLAACWTWLRARPPRRPTTAQAMREHSDYLEALAAATHRDGQRDDRAQ